MKPLPGSPNICLWVREYSSTVVADQRCGWKTMVRLLQLLTMTKCGSRTQRSGLPSTSLMHRGTISIGKISSDVDPGFFDDYVAAINDELDNSLDLVIVDGRARVECVRRAMPKVKPGGLLLLDDTGRTKI